MALVKAIRTHGHLAARPDPLGSEPSGTRARPGPLGPTPEIRAGSRPASSGWPSPARRWRRRSPSRGATAAHIAYEVEHISVHDERVWLRSDRIGSLPTRAAGGGSAAPRAPDQGGDLREFLHKAYLGQKRFSIEGVDALVPMLDVVIGAGRPGQGAREVAIGMAHRGRFNVLVHTVGRPYETILAEFEGGGQGPPGRARCGTGDVKYHLGAEGAVRTASGRRSP